MKKSKESAGGVDGLRVVNRFFIPLLIMYFAGTATGSCLSYGHSCWGAHGKRNYNAPRVVQQQAIRAIQEVRPVGEVKTDGNPEGFDSQNPWHYSRLVTGRLAVPVATSNVYKHPGNRWHGKQNIRSLTENWDNQFDTNRNSLIRNPKADNTDDTEDMEDLHDSFEERQMIKPRDESSDVMLLSSRNDYVNNQPGEIPKLRLYKILTYSSEDTRK